MPRRIAGHVFGTEILLQILALVGRRRNWNKKQPGAELEKQPEAELE